MSEHEGFVPGEIAILQNTRYCTEYEGQDVLVQSYLVPHLCVNMWDMSEQVLMTYWIESMDGLSMMATPDQLRKKPKKSEPNTYERETHTPA